MRLFVGWDVGGWHCDRNASSRDALGSNRRQRRRGRRNRTAVARASSSRFMDQSGPSVVSAMLDLCGVKCEELHRGQCRYRHAAGLAARDDAAGSGRSHQCECVHGRKPLHPTKHRVGLDPARPFTPVCRPRHVGESSRNRDSTSSAPPGLRRSAHWRKTDDAGRTVTAIETYPAVALKMDRLLRLQAAGSASHRRPSRDREIPLHDDIRDALACALVSYLFAECPTIMKPVPATSRRARDGSFYPSHDRARRHWPFTAEVRAARSGC